MKQDYTVSFPIGAETVSVFVELKNVKKLRLKMRDGKFSASAPYFVGKSVVTKFLDDSYDWIVYQYNKYRAQKATQESNGMFLFGKKYRIAVYKGEASVEVKDEEISVTVPDDSEPQKIFLSWLHGFANSYLIQKTEEIRKKYAGILGVFQPVQINVVSVKSYWGKCFYAQNKINYNLALIQADEECITEVVCHELAHFRAHDHGKEFHNVLEMLCLYAKSARKKLARFVTHDFLPVLGFSGSSVE